MGEKNSKALVLLSGGQDSTTACYWTLNRYAQVSAITFDYGQVHEREIACAQNIAEDAGIDHTVMKLDIFNAARISTLIKNGEDEGRNSLPDTFVPGRNIIFAVHAGVIAYREDINVLVMGVSQVDYSGYPDCRRDTIDAIEKTLRLGMEFDISIITPLIDLSKRKTVELCIEEGCLEKMALTHTCYRGEYPPCGECAACCLRAKGFEQAEVPDPLLEKGEE